MGKRKPKVIQTIMKTTTSTQHGATSYSEMIINQLEPLS